jgi:hypothetical protein
MYSQYDIQPDQIDELMGEMGLKAPVETAEFIRDNYVGSFTNDEDIGKNYIENRFPLLPQAIVDAIDMDALGTNIRDSGSFAHYFDAENDVTLMFRIPESRRKPKRAKDSEESEESEHQVIGVEDGVGMLVLDEGSNMHRSSEGYLTAFPRVARTGIQTYRGHEMGKPDVDTVRIYRPESEVFAPDSLRSYAHKPVTNDHPREAVTKDNWRKYAIGNMADEILRDGGFIRIPVTIMDGDAIRDVEEGKRELSPGYTMELDWTPGETPDGQAYDGVQRNIRINHLALVAAARGGKSIRIGDSNGEGVEMKTITIDSASVSVDDVGAQIIPRYVSQLETRAKTAEDSLAAITTRTTTEKQTQDAAIATLTAENATLKKKVEDAKTTPQQLDQLVRDRAVVVAQARSVLGDRVITDGRTDADVKRQVVDAAMGAVAKGWTDEQVASSFAVLTKDAQVSFETRDQLGPVLSNPAIVQDARESAYDEYDHNLKQAHLPEARRTKFVPNNRPGYRQ